MPAYFAALFGAVFIIALVAVILSTFLFRSAPPLKRSALTAAAAWLVSTLIAWALGRSAGTLIWQPAVFLAPFALVVWLLMWRSYAAYWEPDTPEEVVCPALPFEEHAGWEVVPAPEPHRNYLVRHWRGECSLPASYWLNTVIIGNAVIFGTAAALGAVGRSGVPLRIVAIASLLFLAGTVLVWLWGAVGTWRSAQLHEDRGGSGGWAIAAQVMVVLSAFGMLLQFRPYVLQGTEFAVLAAGGDPLGEAGTLTLSQDGTALRVEGMLTNGISGRFRAMAADAPQLRLVILDSPGGRQLEAMRIGATITARRLDTRAEGQCLSACTFVLLAGRERTASPATPIGFHRASFPGWSAADSRAAAMEMEADYRRAGIPADFIRRVVATPAESMWVPTEDELLAANVLTTVETVVTAGGR